MREFKQIQQKDVDKNVFELIGDDWMLVTAGTTEACNMMTASWGGLGVLWHYPVAFVFVRPQRYTDLFIRENDFLSLCFFEESYRDVLKLCGSKSGRDIDKVKETGLTVREGEHGTVWFDESKLVLECRKLYAGAIDSNNFIDTSIISKEYPSEDFHHIYIAEIQRCMVPKD